MTEPTPSRRRRREPTEAELQARAERKAERMALVALSKIESRTGLARYRVASVLFRVIASERD